MKNSIDPPIKYDGKDMMNSEGGQASETETTETTETTENEENEQGSPNSDPSELLLIEQDFEFKTEVWYRVVIEFDLSKIRV